MLCFCIALSGQNKNAELLNYETSISVKNGKLCKTELVEIRIITREGEKYTNVTIPYSKITTVSGIDAYILDQGGNKVKTLKKSDIINKSDIADGSFFEDSFVSEFSLNYNILPYTLCYTYKTEADEFMHIDYWQPVLSANIPTLKATLSLAVPADFRFAWRERLCSSFLADTLSAIKRYRWTASYGNLISSEIFSPPPETLLPAVIIAPEKFRYNISGSQGTWTAFGNWCAGMTDNLEDLPAMDIFKAQTLTSGANDTIEKIKILYHYLQDAVRYINISIKTGGMKPYPASYVAQNKYGDCKALSNYFRALLDASGIKSFYTLVKCDYPIDKTDKTFPSQQFDHVIVSIPVAHDTLFLDATGKMAFGYTGTFIQNRDAFIVSKEQSRFACIPGLSINDVLETRKIFISASVTGSISCSVSHCFRGEKYEALASLQHEYNATEKERALHDYLSSDGFEMIKCNMPPFGRDSREIWVYYSGRYDKLFKVYGNDQIISLPPSGMPKFEDPSFRKMPVQIDFPVARTDTIVFMVPDGWVVSSLPPVKEVTDHYGTYSVSFHGNGKNVDVIRSFVLNTGYYKIEEYKEFFGFIRTIKNIENSSRIVLSKRPQV